MSKKKARKKQKKESAEEVIIEEKVTNELTPEEQISELKDKQIRLFAEFENFKKRTAKERIELYKNAGENILVSMLPILDDFERSIKANKENGKEDEGVQLIYNKFKNTLESKGLKIMDDAVGEVLNTDFHEAITNVPATSEDLKGKIIDTIEKGYFLNEKVIRYAKVVVANN